MLAYAFYHTTGIMFGPRYYYEAMPSLLLLTARGFSELDRLPLRLWPRRGSPESVLAAATVPAVLGIALSLYLATFYLPAQLDLYRNYNYSSDAELRAVKRANIHHAIVFVVQKPSYAWWAYGNVFFDNDPLLRGDIIYARDFGPSDPTLYSFLPGRTHYLLYGTKLTRMP
jgi:hypothetical protein